MIAQFKEVSGLSAEIADDRAPGEQARRAVRDEEAPRRTEVARSHARSGARPTTRPSGTGIKKVVQDGDIVGARKNGSIVLFDYDDGEVGALQLHQRLAVEGRSVGASTRRATTCSSRTLHPRPRGARSPHEPRAERGRRRATARRAGCDALRTEFAFELPYGYVDDDGQVHTTGVMRLATARDEILPLRDPRVRDNEAYLTVRPAVARHHRARRRSRQVTPGHRRGAVRRRPRVPAGSLPPDQPGGAHSCRGGVSRVRARVRGRRGR